MNYPHHDRLRNGYREIWCPSHPRNRDGYMYEHTLVMENFMGRYLFQNEVVHHKDENRSNNKLENLILFSSKSDHARLHKLISLGQKVTLLKTKNGSFKCVKLRIEPVCEKCGNPNSVNKTGLCRECYLKAGRQLSCKNIPDYRSLEELHSNGLSYQGIADMFGTSYQTIRSRIRKKIVI